MSSGEFRRAFERPDTYTNKLVPGVSVNRALQLLDDLSKLRPVDRREELRQLLDPRTQPQTQLVDNTLRVRVSVLLRFNDGIM